MKRLLRGFYIYLYKLKVTRFTQVNLGVNRINTVILYTNGILYRLVHVFKEQIDFKELCSASLPAPAIFWKMKEQKFSK